jgi:hypothetical protein
MNTIAALPKIIRILETHDAGEYGATTCPHCGAKCRYYKVFEAVTSDGEVVKLAAAAGCIQLFPTSRLATIHGKLLDKQRDYSKKGWTLNRSDTRILDLIDSAAKQLISESDAVREIAAERASMAAWRKQRNAR